MIKFRERSMKAIAVVALSFLFAGVGATAASASDANQVDYWQAQYPGVGTCVKFDPPGTANSYGHLSDDGKSVVLNANQALLVVKGGSSGDNGDGNNVFENPVAGDSYQSPVNGGENVPDVSHWIVCEYKTPPVDTPVTPAALTVNDLCGVENDTITGVPADPHYSGPTVTGNMQSVTFTPGDGETLGSPLPSGWTAGDGGVATFSHTFSNEPCVSETQFVTIIWNMNPVGAPPVFNPAQTIVDHKVTSTPELGAFDHLLVGKCVGFQVDVYKYTNEADKAAVDYLISSGTLYGPNNPTEPLISPRVEGTAWKFYQDSVCPPELKLIVPAVVINDPCDPDNASFVGVQDENITWSEVEGWLVAQAAPGYTFGENKFEWDQSTAEDSGEVCPIEITGVSVTIADPPICGPNNDPINIPVVEGLTFDDSGWVDGERTITATADKGYVLDGQSEWTFTDEATACPVTTVAPTVVPICLPNNDTVTIPEVDGVTYTDSGWVDGERTITATADEGYALTEESVTSWTFTDVPAAECPDETGFSGTPELAYSGASSSTNGLIGLAIFLMASGTALVALRSRAAK